jgi:hypothetical protein
MTAVYLSGTPVGASSDGRVSYREINRSRLLCIFLKAPLPISTIIRSIHSGNDMVAGQWSDCASLPERASSTCVAAAWDRISQAEALRELFVQGGAEVPDVVTEMNSHALNSPDDWWPMVLGTGYRGTIEQLDTQARSRVRKECLDFIRSTGVQSVEANVLYATATKP